MHCKVLHTGKISSYSQILDPTSLDKIDMGIHSSLFWSDIMKERIYFNNIDKLESKKGAFSCVVPYKVLNLG